MGYQPTDIELKISDALGEDYRLPHRRMEAWKWSDVAAAVSPDLPGLTERHTAVHYQLTSVSEPLVLDFEPGHHRADITVEAGAKAVLIENYHSDKAAFYDVDLRITLGEGATLIRVQTQADHKDTVRLVTANMNIAKSARLEQFALAEGGKLIRLESRVKAARDVSAVMNGAYILNDKRHADFTSHFDIEDENVEIEQGVKGVVTDQARGVFQGKFHVLRAGQHTDADMRHDALMLSENSEVRAKPELEIYADDVACEHGNTVGALDENALFYMRQRGIPAKEARSLLIEAFVAEVFDDLSLEDYKTALVERVRSWLEQEA